MVVTDAVTVAIPDTVTDVVVSVEGDDKSAAATVDVGADSVFTKSRLPVLPPHVILSTSGGADDREPVSCSPNQDQEYLSYVRVNYITRQTRAVGVVTAIPKWCSRGTHQILKNISVCVQLCIIIIQQAR